MAEFLLDNIIWLFFAAVGAAGVFWTTLRGDSLTLQPQAAIIQVSRSGGLFLDIRASKEFEQGHVPRAKHFPPEQMQSRLPGIDKFKQKPVVVICTSGITAKKTARELREKGFEQAYVLAGGINAWKNDNLPLTTK